MFHAGAALDANTLVTSGGRVLAVTVKASTLAEAVKRAYQSTRGAVDNQSYSCQQLLSTAVVPNVTFEGVQYRRDIAKQGLAPQGLTYKQAGVDIDAGDALVSSA